MAAVYAYNVLTNRDKQSTKYIERFADRVPASTALAQAAERRRRPAARCTGRIGCDLQRPLRRPDESGGKGS